MKILLVDDHAIVRKGARRLLEDAFLGSVFGEASTSAEASDRVRAEPWDIVVLDLSLPGRGGLETLKELRSLEPALRVLVMTMHAEEQYALRAFRAGAAGYITKASAADELVVAVRKIVERGKYVTTSLAEGLVSRLAEDRHQAPHESLSDRELEVLRRFGRGKTVKEVAAELSLSAKTVSTYRTRILVKLGMRTTAELVRYAVAAGLEDA